MIGFRSDIVIALGGNLPLEQASPAATMTGAIAELAAEGLVIRAVSRFFATPCFPAGAGPDYVNAAILATGMDDPAAVLGLLHRIEARFGRARAQRWGMRTLDLDLLAFGDAVLPDAGVQGDWRALPPDRQATRTPDRLILPHPRLQDRAFVLVPMCDIAPDWVHPLLGVTARQMLAALPQADIAEIRPI